MGSKLMADRSYVEHSLKPFCSLAAIIWNPCFILPFVIGKEEISPDEFLQIGNWHIQIFLRSDKGTEAYRHRSISFHFSPSRLTCKTALVVDKQHGNLQISYQLC